MVWRVTDRATFLALRRSRQRARCGPINVNFTRDDGPMQAKVGYAVGKRVGGAVVRNRLRRRLRSVVSEVEEQLRPGSYLVTAAPEANGLTHEELKRRVVRAMACASEDAGK